MPSSGPSGPAGSAVPAAGRRRLAMVLLVAGISALAFNMRTAVSGLPPVFPEVQSSLRLSGTAVALLAALPVLCFGVCSGFAAPLSRRLGEERVLGLALVLLAAGLLLRGALPGAMLFPGTVLAGAAIALMNVLLPSLIKRRSPDRAGQLIGVYLLMLAGGAIIASLVAVPALHAAGGAERGVRLTLGLWALPAVLAAVAWLPQLRFRTLPEARLAAGGGMLAMGRHALAWQVTGFMALQSLSYYAALSWFPTLLRDRGASPVHAGDLLALMNLGNAVTALLIPVLAHRAANQSRLVAVSMLATAGGLAGVGFGPLGSAAAWMLLLGLGQGASLGLGIYFAVARAPDPVTSASLSAFSQGVGYLIATTGPLLLGFLHEATGGWTVPVLALLVVAAGQLASGWLAGRAMTVPALAGRGRAGRGRAGRG